MIGASRAGTNSDDLALPFTGLEIRGKQPCHEEDRREDANQEHWPFSSTVVYRAEG